MRFHITLLWLAALVLACQTVVRKKRIVGGRTADRVQQRPASPLPASPSPASPPTAAPTSSSTSAPVAILYGESGAVRARVHGLVDRSLDPPFYSFLGIRYAEPPVGRFRFQRPRKLPVEGEVDARRHGSPCVQPHPFLPFKTTGSEDCLFLNVYTPRLPDVQVSSLARSLRCGDDEEDAASLPVIVWNHGGGYRQGSASQYGPKYLVSKNIVVVTLQYRLGSLGFLSHGNKDSPGNAALCDQLTALEWVKENIDAFGGDPKKVSLAGHDAGASAAMLLSQSKHGAGLFRSVVAMSGSSLSAWATDEEPGRAARELARSVSCPTNDSAESVRCLQQVSATRLITAGSDMMVPNLPSQDTEGDLRGFFSSSAPVVDGPTDLRFLPTILQESAKRGLEEGSLPPIPLLTGITRDETSNLFSAQQKSEILKKIKESPDYLNQIFLPKLVKTTKGLAILTNTLTGTLTNYLAFLPGEGKKGPLGRLVEASSDALFALPAFLTSSLWKRSGGPVFLYSFDHPSPFSASVFSSSPFKLLPEIGGRRTRDVTEKEDGVGHGEDLFYLFEPKSMEGEDLPGLQLTSPEDAAVLELLTSTIAKFVKTGNPSMTLDGQESPWLPFSEEQNNYISISSKPKVGTQFKFCEMGLWGGMLSRLLSPQCSDAFNPVAILPQLPPALSGLFGGSERQGPQGTPRPKPQGGLQVPGLLG